MGSLRAWRRRQWLVDRRLQLPFTSVLLWQATLIVAVVGLFAYVANDKLMTVALSLASNDSIGLVGDRVYRSSQALLVSVLAAIALTALVQIAFGIYASHKLAGPVLKMKRSLSDIAAGRPAGTVTFRRGDYLDELAGALNAVLEPIERRRVALERALPLLERSLESLEAAALRGRPPSREPELEAFVAEVAAVEAAFGAKSAAR